MGFPWPRLHNSEDGGDIPENEYYDEIDLDNGGADTHDTGNVSGLLNRHVTRSSVAFVTCMSQEEDIEGRSKCNPGEATAVRDAVTSSIFCCSF